MKHFYLFITAALLFAVSFSGCEKKENTESDKNTLSVVGATDSRLSFDGEDNDDVTLTVTTNASGWTFTATEWIEATEDGNKLVVNVKDNPGDERNGTIKFSAGTADDVTISVTQAAKGEEAKNTLSVSPDTAISFEAEDDTEVTLTVTTNASGWDFTVPNWLNADKDGSTLVVSVKEDNTGTKLEGTIKFTAGTADPVEISVSQKAPEGSGDGIAIDGNFDDWADISVAVTGNANMLEAKYYYDGTDIFMYFKANKEVITGDWQTMQIFFDTDMDNTTGTSMGYAFGNDANGNGIDYLLAPNISTLGSAIGGGAGAYLYEVASDGWFAQIENTANIIGDNVTNCVYGIGDIIGDYYELEIKVILETLPWDLPNKFRIAPRTELPEGNVTNYFPVYEWDLAE